MANAARLVVLAVAAAGWAAPAWAQSSTAPHLMVAISNHAGVDAHVLSGALVITKVSFRQVGVEVDWRAAADAALATDAANAWVSVSLLGRGMTTFGTPDRILGIAPARAAGPQQVFVFYDRLERLARLGSQAIERVLARVIAHEIGHALMPGDGHSESGAMMPSLRLTAADALAAPVFTSDQGIAIRRALTRRHEHRETPALAASASAAAIDAEP
jgi:hypothetical protein